jgi:hypothetical protein
MKAGVIGLIWSLSWMHHAMGAQYTVSVSYSNSAVVISWPAEYIGSQLQQTASLSSPWQEVTNSVKTNRVSLPSTDLKQFFRLFAPSVPTVGLVARYDLNGDANDSIGGRHGSIQGATPTSNRFTNGSSAYSFNGTNAYIEIPDADVFSIATTGRFSLSVWMRPGTLTFPVTEGTGYVHWMGKGGSGQQEWTCRMYSSDNTEGRENRTSFYVFNLSGGLGAGSYVQEPVTVLAWLHFVATVDVAANTIKWYKNGSLRDTDTLSGFSITPENGTAPIRLGTRDFASYFRGAIDNLLIYDRVLSAFEVNQLYNDQTP